MTEKKFKLKKDGECVGYMRFDRFGDIEVRLPGEDEWNNQYDAEIDHHFGRGKLLRLIDFDSIHDFICPDRNGKEVYCDDWVWFVFGSNDRVKVQVGWDDYRKQYRMFDRQAGSTVWYEFDSFHPIELIEEQP